MHITEGYLPALHAAGWGIAAAPFVAHGVHRLERERRTGRGGPLLLGAAGGFAFVLSALKLPSLGGSSSHATGIALGAILLGPAVASILGTLVLLFQALLLAHGGLTTLGANAFSMAIAGAWVAWATFRLARRAGAGRGAAALLAAALSDLCTYAVTALQLALAYPDPASGVAGSLVAFGGVFLPTQLPLAVIEGILTALAIRQLAQHATPELRRLPGAAELEP